MMGYLALQGRLPWVLGNPQRVGRLDKEAWEELIRHARDAEVLGQLEIVLNEAGVLQAAPLAARRHLQMAARLAEKQAVATRGELQSVHEALQPVGVPVILLKGAAYCATGHRAARGRLLTDIDVLVPRSALKAVEQQLTRAGWSPASTNAYDDRYYREWMHEIPPMQRMRRSSVLNVHHALAAPTSGFRHDTQTAFDATCAPNCAWPNFRVLSQEDLLMHAATHLFLGEFHKGLRDLYDVHVLLSDFSRDGAFWARLLNRSADMGLLLPVTDALRHARRVFETDVPEDVLRGFRAKARSYWPAFTRDWLFDQVLRPGLGSATDRTARVATWLAYARSHWLRMPMPRLAYHLSHKWMASL